MDNMNLISMAAEILKEIDMFKNSDAVAVSYLKNIPESYSFVKDIIVFNYRVSIYDTNSIGKSHLVDIAHLGKFQII